MPPPPFFFNLEIPLSQALCYFHSCYQQAKLPNKYAAGLCKLHKPLQHLRPHIETSRHTLESESLLRHISIKALCRITPETSVAKFRSISINSPMPSSQFEIVQSLLNITML